MGPTFNELSGGLVGEELRIVKACFATRGKNKGALRASKPFDTADCIEGKPDARFKGMANYVWRMLCFDFLPYAPHVCMPVTAEWDLHASYPRFAYGSGEYVEQKIHQKELRVWLDRVIKTAEANLPITRQGGAMRWAKALGAA